MTDTEAQCLSDDLEKQLRPRDYCESIYVSVKGVGTRVFKRCAYHEADEYIFIWTQNRVDNYTINRELVGDCVIIPYDHNTHVSLKKVT